MYNSLLAAYDIYQMWIIISFIEIATDHGGV